MRIPSSEKEKRDNIRAIMRDIAREIWRLPAARQNEVSNRLRSMLRNLEKENNRPVDWTSL
jgi:hypothetical protein